MALRTRISLILLGIVALLVVPAVYGLVNLWELREIATNLKSRDAEAILALGRLNTALGEVENAQRIHLALGGAPPDERGAAARRVEGAAARVDAAFAMLDRAGYAAQAAAARERWRQAADVAAEERREIDGGDLDAAESLQSDSLDPTFERLDAALDPIGTAIDRAGDVQVRRAGEIASEAARTTVLALCVAVLAAWALGLWLTRGILRPIRQLNRATGVVAAGDFAPDLGVSLERPDELGDLGRAFAAMTEQLAELDRLKAEFVSVASHELKTPLSVIKGYVTLVRQGNYGEPDERLRKVLARLDTQADQLDRMIRRLLDVSRFEAGGGRLELGEIELVDFLRHLETSFEALALQNRIRFPLELAPGLPARLVGDADRLNEVLGNLLSNAFKFTPAQGEIRLRAEPADLDGQPGVAISVADSGVGIPEDKLPRVFEKFFQVGDGTQPRTVGSGLGLAIAREIVEAHGGTISATSEVGRGATFRVLLPLDATGRSPEPA